MIVILKYNLNLVDAFNYLSGIKMFLKNSLGRDFIAIQNWAAHHIRFNIVNCRIPTLMECVAKLSY